MLHNDACTEALTIQETLMPTQIYIRLLTKLVRSRRLDIGQVLFCVFMDRDEVEVHKHAKKERGQYPAILTEQAWSIKDILY